MDFTGENFISILEWHEINIEQVLKTHNITFVFKLNNFLCKYIVIKKELDTVQGLFVYTI